MNKTAFIIGCGSIGERHAKNLNSLGVNISVFDIDKQKQQEVASKVNAESHNSVEEGLAESPDMTFICTPSNHHISPAQQAAEAGCDLFVEKPLSNDAEGVEDLVETVENKNLISMIGCNYRFHPAIQKVKQLIDDRYIGDIVSARIEMGSYLPDWHPWEDYRDMYSSKEGVGGILLDAIHGINYGRWFFGAEELVTGLLSYDSSLEIETEDTVNLITRYENNVQCEYHFDYLQRTPIRSGQITGDVGSIRWGGVKKSVRRYDLEKDDWITEETYDNWNINQMYINMLEHFLHCVTEHESTTSPIKDGWKDLQLVLAAKKSSDQGKHIQL